MKSILTKVLAPFLLVGAAIGSLFASVKLGWISEETAFWLIPIAFTVIFVLLAVFVLLKGARVWLWPTGTLAIVQLIGTLVWLFSSILESLWDPLKYSIGATSLVFAVMLIVWGISTIRARMLEKKMAEGSGTGADLERIRKDMRDALDLLRRAGQGRNALYQLPWYLVMGRPAAGKTVAIKNSELGLPVKRDWVKGVGGTYTADWFFTNELIFLDTPGGWVTDGATEDGQQTWRELMRLLRKYRGRQPLDGLIIVVPADDLLGLSEDELEDQATNIREVVDLIHGQLDFRFPIYVLVTKCDLVEGFVDFFRGLPSKRRHEILGWSNPDPNQADAEIIVEKGFATVKKRLQSYRLEMLGKVARRTQARRLFFFTEEFRGLERPLSVFTQALFGGDRYSEPPVFRGFYFSSGTQEGAPLGKAISGVAKAFGLAPPQAEAESEEGSKRSYFLLDLFRELMVRDEGLVGRSAAHWWRRRRNTAFGVFAPATIAMTLLLLSGLALALNKQTYSRIAERVPTITQELRETRQSTPLPIEKGIEDALERTERLRGFHREMTGFSPFRGFGMRRPQELATRTLNLFAEELSRTVLHPTLAGAQGITMTGSCIDRINVLRSVVWLRTGRRAGFEDLAALDKVWALDVDAQEDRAIRVRQELRQQYVYLKNQIDPENSSIDLLPGFSVRRAAQAILDDCGQQGSTSALAAYAQWQNTCRITRTPSDIAGCYRQLNEVIRTAGEDYAGFLKSFESLKDDLGTLVDDVPEGKFALEKLSHMDVAARETSDCLSKFDRDIVEPIKQYAVREEMVTECRQAVDGGPRRERFTIRESVIKTQDAILEEESKDLNVKIYDYNQICSNEIAGFDRIDFNVIKQVASSYRRVACFGDLPDAAPQALVVVPTPRPGPVDRQPSTDPVRKSRPAPVVQRSGSRWFKSPRGVGNQYGPEALAFQQEEWEAQLEALRGAGYSPEQTEFESGKLRGSISGFASGYAKAWTARLASLELQDPTPPVTGWLRGLVAAPDFPRYIEEAKTAVAAIPADAKPPFDVLGQRIAPLGAIADLDVAAYLAMLAKIADEIEVCENDGAAWSDYSGKVRAKDDSVTLVEARAWVRSNVGPGLAGGVLTSLFERPLDAAESFILSDNLLQRLWEDLAALHAKKIGVAAPFSGQLSDEPIEFRDMRALLGRESGAVAGVVAAAKGERIAADAQSWLDTADRLSRLFFKDGSDEPRPLRLVAAVDPATYEPEAFGKNYRLEELKIFIGGSQIPTWNPDSDVPLQLEAILLGDGKSEFAYIEGDVSERKGAMGRMFGKKWKPGEGIKAAGPFEGPLAPLKLFAAGLKPGANGLEFTITIEWKKEKTGVVTIPVRLSGEDAGPLMELLRNGLPAPPAEIVAR